MRLLMFCHVSMCFFASKSLASTSCIGLCCRKYVLSGWGSATSLDNWGDCAGSRLDKTTWYLMISRRGCASSSIVPEGGHGRSCLYSRDHESRRGAIWSQETQLELIKQYDKRKLGELRNPDRQRCKSSPSPLTCFHVLFHTIFHSGSGGH